MTLMRRVSSGLLTAGAVAAVVGMAAAPAMAATTLTVKISNGGTITAIAKKTVLTDGQVSVTCSSTSTKPASKATGSIPTGTHKGTSPVKVGSAASLAFNNCVGPLGKVTTKIMALPYAISVDSKTTATGKTDGIISGVKVAVSMISCSFTVTGSSPGYYNNGNHTLNMTKPSGLPTKPLNSARLTVSNVSGCVGVVKNGDHPTFVSSYTVSRKVTVKSS